ncbi:5'/3'-nucleotidase SurE [Chloroflexota bacterium]
MRILVTNDDGITAPGLWALVKEIAKVGEVIVVAPDREQSAVGTSVTLHQPLRVRAVRPVLQGIKTYTVEGTPADSVIIALKLLLNRDVDLLLSGINEGPNLGNDVLISGTVGAALQGHFYGLSSIAISVADMKKSKFDAAAKFSALLAQQAASGNLPPGTLLNVNLPNRILSQISGVEITRLAQRNYSDRVKRGHDGKRDYYWIVRGRSEWKEEEGTDVWAIKQKKVSITPLQRDLTRDENTPNIEKLCSSLSQSLRTGNKAR